MFTINQAKGFHIQFANGWTVSVQWGPGNYCENRSGSFQAPLRAVTDTGFYSSATAECAVFNPANKMTCYWGGYDQVKGYMTADEVFALMTEVQALSPSHHIATEFPSFEEEDAD
jgi:hypothetical protein